jgi:hypothetical protein
MSLPKTMEGIANTEAARLASMKVVLPIKKQMLGDVLLVTRRGAAKLSPKVWQPKQLLDYCDKMEKTLEHPAIAAATHTGIELNAWLAFAQLAAVLIETYDRQMLGWVVRSCDVMAQAINQRAPLTAETLSSLAGELREQLGIKECACSTCVAVAAVHAAEAKLDGDGHTLEEWVPLVAELRTATRELIESIKTPVQVQSEARPMPTVPVTSGYHVDRWHGQAHRQPWHKPLCPFRSNGTRELN